MKKEILLIALGGNALIRKNQKGSAEEQIKNLSIPLSQIARLSSRYRIIITHGNGPQVGNLLRQQECCDTVIKQPLEILVAQTQGQIGFMIESTLDSELMAIDTEHQTKIVSLINYVVVEKNDPAFKNPTKPIGPVFSKEQAEKLPYPMVETLKGYRRVVASPRPVTIIEKKEIKSLIEMGFIVTCCGGGGIPVVRNNNERVRRAFTGIDAVIDKDLVSAKLAEEVGVDKFVITTDVPGVALDFGNENQRFLSKLSVADACRYMEHGHFDKGSMGPKVEAAAGFVKNTGKRAAITSIYNVEATVVGKAGTEFIL